MRVRDVLRILDRENIAYSFSGDMDAEFDDFSKLNDPEAKAVFIRRTGDVAAKIQRVNELKLTLVIVPDDLDCDCPSAEAVIGVEDPRLIFALIQAEIHGPVMKQLGQYPKWVTVGKNCFIAPFCNIGGDGLSANYLNGELIHTLHAGCVVIGDNVRIHSFTAVERAILGETMIGHDCHVDYHCVIGHGVSMGARCRLAPGVKLLGGAIIGDDVAIGAGAIINPGVKIGEGAAVGSGAVVARDVDPYRLVVGVPTRDIGLVEESQGATW